MDDEQFLKFIHNISLLREQKTDLPGKLALAFPFFAAAQYLLYARDTFHSNPNLKLLALYKNNPALFALFVQDCNKQQSFQPKSTDDDILTLINEIPNSNPIENRAGHFHTGKSIPKSASIDPDLNGRHTDTTPEEEDKSLMVMMSFNDWLQHFKTKTQRDKQEEKDKKMLRTAWQKEKLSAAIEEENEEIPEQIFRQAMDSISENSIISESLAVILAKQGKKDKAIDMYKKLSLRNPEKSTYFADRIQELKTTIDF